MKDAKTRCPKCNQIATKIDAPVTLEGKEFSHHWECATCDILFVMVNGKATQVYPCFGHCD